MQAVYIEALPDADTLDLAREWIARKEPKKPHTVLDSNTLVEGLNLVKEYLPDKSAPGNLLQFLRATYDRFHQDDGQRGRISVYDFLATLSQMTGMPQEILDDRHELDIEALRGLFNRRVVGQTEAVNCLVERIALVKAGLQDPSRPLGVFLFVGPTGTGKTEIAKTLSELLFGSKDRMIRLDLSEFQTPDAIDRILGSPRTAQTTISLSDLIRRQPFSVILLDEFEKAHPRIWDLFLQVFDDGRLTDRNGNLADFRRAIIILTSNLGAKISSGTSIGFTLDGATFSPSTVERAVGKTFRPEFINPIDRVVVFHPLSRNVMRRILLKELDDVFLRRGLSKREWAVEWDESAVDFLLKQGFTPDLGARPLRRAIERYLLSPLAITIVQHEFPEGDQFLFVTGDAESLRVEFVDPDAPEEEPLGTEEPAGAPVGPPAEIQLKAVALDARGTSQELTMLRGQLQQLSALISAEDWQTTKDEALKKTGLPDFWESSERFETLSKIEVMDRIESGLRAASSILQRLSGRREKERSTLSPDLLRRLAEQLYLLETAYFDFIGNRPYDALVFIEAHLDTQIPRESVIAFFLQIDSMYVSWAEKRRMQHEQLDKTIDVDNLCRSVVAVSGFGAFSILEPESGLHVLETPKDKRAFERIKINVRVVPQPKKYTFDDKDWLQQAMDISSRSQEGSREVVRRYRIEPSPLVRDNTRNWRSGRLDRVLAGDFDLIT